MQAIQHIPRPIHKHDNQSGGPEGREPNDAASSAASDCSIGTSMMEKSRILRLLQTLL